MAAVDGVERVGCVEVVLKKGRRGTQGRLADTATAVVPVVCTQLGLPKAPLAVGALPGVALGAVAAATRRKDFETLRGTTSRISRSKHHGGKLMINRRRRRRSVKQ